MLAALRDETASALPPASAALDRVVVTRPPVKGLTDEDVRDALEYIGLRPWLISEGQAGMYPTDLLEVHAVLAAHGYGLCTNYKDLFECWEEVEAMPEHVVFFASFTRQSLHTSLATVTDAFGWSQKPLFANETLMDNGLGSLEYHSKPSVFWAEVRAQLARAVSRSPRPITKVLMAGENATHPDFVSTLEDVLKDAGGNTGRLQADSIDPTFAAARGAALYGSWRQQAPLGCREKANCEKDREKERGERLERTLEL
jgi:hypothetical protein